MARIPSVSLSPAEKRACFSLSGVYALRMLGMFLVLPVLSLYALELMPENHPDRLIMVGWAMSAYGLTQAMLQLPLGMASDKFGRKKVICLGLMVFALGSFLATTADNIYLLIVARAIQGAGAISAAVTALLADLTRESVRTRAMASIGLTIGLTFSISLVASPILVKWLGVKGLFALMGALTLISMAVVIWFTPQPAQSKLHEDTEAQSHHIMAVLRNKQLLRLNFGIFALQASLMAMFTTLPFALSHLGLNKTEHWAIYLPATVIGLILMIPAIIVGETRGKLKPIMLLGIFLIYLAQMALWGTMSSLWWIACWVSIYFIGFNILEASMPSLVSKIAPSQLKGTAMGVYNTLQSIGLFVGGALGGYLYQKLGYHGIFGFCVLLMMAWFVVAVRAPAPQPVRNIMFAVPHGWQHDLQGLQTNIQQTAGVETVSFSQDKQTLFIKARQHGCDEEKIKQILTGA